MTTMARTAPARLRGRNPAELTQDVPDPAHDLRETPELTWPPRFLSSYSRSRAGLRPRGNSDIPLLMSPGIRRFSRGAAKTRTEPQSPLVRTPEETYERALKFLSHRSRSAEELEKRLIDGGEPAAHVALAMERLRANGLIDDARFAEARARAGIVGKARSRRRLEQDLAQRGVAREVAREAIQQVLADEGTSEVEVAVRAARKKAKSLARLDPREQREKLYAFLARQGHAPDVARRAVSAALEAPPPDETDE
jgi:regulatory protein